MAYLFVKSELVHGNNSSVKEAVFLTFYVIPTQSLVIMHGFKEIKTIDQKRLGAAIF